MVTINPNLVPTVQPGNIFNELTNDNTLNVRWYCQYDPVFYGVLNRPLADIVLRQLIIAKAVDQLESSLGHTALFPFLLQPRIASGSGAVDVPINWLWDINISLPAKWQSIRLAKIKRISGSNSGSGGYTGKLRLIFTGVQQGSTIEVALAYVDYLINSPLTYQIVTVAAVLSTEGEPVFIDPSEVATIAGFVIFGTLNTSASTVQNFLNLLAPPTNTTLNSSNTYVYPAVYELIDAVSSDPSGDFSTTSVSHGTGMLEASAYNVIPALDSNVQSWINTFNYPFDTNANLTSIDSIVIPIGLFSEFNITAPAGDEPTGDVSGTFYPVWVSRIERVDATSNQLRFYFATYNITDSAPSTQLVEFATLDLTNSMSAGEIVDIVPISNLELQNGSDATTFNQHFGRGHVMLSTIWGGTSNTIINFFNAFELISDSPADTIFSKSSTRLSSFGISRVPKYTPTIGQSQALVGSSARLTVPINPSDGNRYVTEADQGLGNAINLESQPGIVPDVAIQAIGYSGALCHRSVVLIMDSTQTPTNNPNYYQNTVLPRLTILFGRSPQHGDEWFDGVRYKRYVSVGGIGGVWIG